MWCFRGLDQKRDLDSKSLEMPICSYESQDSKVRPTGHNGIFQGKRGEGLDLFSSIFFN